MQSVAYMLDTNVWSVYAGAYADYAIAGPSVEILLKSYSEKYKVDYRAQANTNIGYQFSKDGGTNWENYYIGMLDAMDSLYVIRITKKAEAMWLSSPSTIGSDCVLYTACDGSVNRHNYNANYAGFRPLVCLNSNVQLEKISDGIYGIKEN